MLKYFSERSSATSLFSSAVVEHKLTEEERKIEAIKEKQIIESRKIFTKVDEQLTPKTTTMYSYV
jgi:hypothetical protein